ncbi:MAG: type III-A CRISPR-associated RAMP protein Csm3 [Lachnospirales bacterium]
MFGKILIKGEIELLTGLHIGTCGEFAAIGAVDSPVIRDAISQDPIIPGSSLKGKLRCMLANKYNTNEQKMNKDDCKDIKRIFGSTSNSSRFIFSDMQIINKDELEALNIYTHTETKFENNIDRFTGVANPRQIERVIRGCRFGMDIIYNVEVEADIINDIKLLSEAMKLLQFDYLGGNGSRGYGKIAFRNLSAQELVGEFDDKYIDEINKILEDVKPYEL